MNNFKMYMVAVMFVLFLMLTACGDINTGNLNAQGVQNDVNAIVDFSGQAVDGLEQLQDVSIGFDTCWEGNC